MSKGIPPLPRNPQFENGKPVQLLQPCHTLDTQLSDKFMVVALHTCVCHFAAFNGWCLRQYDELLIAVWWQTCLIALNHTKVVPSLKLQLREKHLSTNNTLPLDYHTIAHRCGGGGGGRGSPLMSTILFWLGYTFIPIENLFSQCGYQKAPNRKSLGCQPNLLSYTSIPLGFLLWWLTELQIDVNWTILIGRYSIDQWPMWLGTVLFLKTPDRRRRTQCTGD